MNNERKLKKQLQYYSDNLTSNDKTKSIIEEANNLIKKIDAWEANIVESRTQNGQDVINWPSKLGVEFFFLKGLVDATDPKVTQGVKNKLADVQVLWKNEKAKLDGIYTAVNSFNSLYQKANIEAVQK